MPKRERTIGVGWRTDKYNFPMVSEGVAGFILGGGCLGIAESEKQDYLRLSPI